MINEQNKNFYNIDAISGIMSLRKPQKKSLKILSEILKNVQLSKETNLDNALKKINALCPICTEFERNFVSLTFALATGVGKTRLMGACITYLYTNYGYNNFFVVAPNTTIYDKLRKDLGDFSSNKYVFKGLSDVIKHKIITGDDYKNKQISFFETNINIFVYNISKFDKENTNMRKLHENIGDSFFGYISNLDNLVMLMDESHHYRADRGFEALNDLKPILGLEFTATPYVSVKNKQVQFKNVVYDYPLSMSIADGYTRTPYAITRKNLAKYDFGDEQLDKLMLNDGIKCHENIKNKLLEYCKNNNKELVKPFMLVVCKDTEHTNKIKNYICSDEFYDGKYIDKTIVLHSKQIQSESDANIEALLRVEKYESLTEIVIHVDKLKEGWDVNNLYTIVPLRMAASKILREQMIGRGLRLPFGERTGDDEIDAVYLTAHDKFDEILDEAQKGNSIFRTNHIIELDDNDTINEYIEPKINIVFDLDNSNAEFYSSNSIKETPETNLLLNNIKENIKEVVENEIKDNKYKPIDKENLYKLANEHVEKLKENKDYAEILKDNELPILKYLTETEETLQKRIFDLYIPIPKIVTNVISPTEYIYNDFDLDVKNYNYSIVENDILIKNMVNTSDSKVIKGNLIDFEAYNPQKELIKLICEYPEIDYDKTKNLLCKLIDALFFYLRHKLNTDNNGIKNIVMMNKHDMAEKIYSEIVDHITYKNGLIERQVIGINSYNIKPSYNYAKDRICKITNEYKELDKKHTVDIRSVLFTDCKKSVYSEVKFDSRPEWEFAKIIESDKDVTKWLRPAPQEFNIIYAGNKVYEPDFVVEYKDNYYLIEIKNEKEINDELVLLKKDEATHYCILASKYCEMHNMKSWKHLFIIDEMISAATTFDYYVEKCLATVK